MSSTIPNFGKIDFSSGKFSAGEGKKTVGYQSYLQQLAGITSESIDELGGQLTQLISDMNESPANTALLAQYQALMGSYTQQFGVSAGAVAAMKQTGDKILQQT